MPDHRSFEEWRDDLAAVFDAHAEVNTKRAEIRPALKRRAEVLRMLAVLLRLQLK